MLSTTSDHAIRAVLVLARHYGQGPLRADEIADAINAPRNYLGKTLNSLAKEGLVKSSRGPSGGFLLAMHPDTITLAHIVDCFDEPRPQQKCLLGTAPCDLSKPCAAHERWTEVTQARRSPLCSTTIADLLGDRETGMRVCELSARPTVSSVA